ncbi:TPA: hypothetical protein DIV55_02740 [Patescibacteria group bacterium]|nr:hypothetical protein [Patescibacteria group bacterium]
MYNWSIDKRALKKQSTAWRLNQLLNFGLNGEKLNLNLIKKHWKFLSLDPARKKFLRLLIWGKPS